MHWILCSFNKKEMTLIIALSHIFLIPKLFFDMCVCYFYSLFCKLSFHDYALSWMIVQLVAKSSRWSGPLKNSKWAEWNINTCYHFTKEFLETTSCIFQLSVNTALRCHTVLSIDSLEHVSCNCLKSLKKKWVYGMVPKNDL